MSIQVIQNPAEARHKPATKASFTGIMRGEFLKISRLFWLLLSILTAGFLLLFLVVVDIIRHKNGSAKHPTPFSLWHDGKQSERFRVLVGIVLLILTSLRLGVSISMGQFAFCWLVVQDEVQLLLAKMATLALMALALLVAFSLLTAILTCLCMFATIGNLNALSALTAAFWSNTGICLLAVIISMGATILLSVAMNALGRSLTFGLSAYSPGSQLITWESL